MKKTKKSQTYISTASVIMNSSPATLILAVIGIFIGIFFIFYQSASIPIERTEAIDTYDNGYFFIGCFCCAGGAFLLLYTIGSIIYKRREAARHALKSKNAGTASTPIRSAAPAIKSKILLEASVNGYRICYRRVKSVNELVISGKVYDEKKGVIEFAHKLCAILDGHSIEAGYDENDCSYIMFDGKIIKNKKRYF